MLNYFFTIKSHIIDLFMMGRFMQHRFEIDVPFVVGWRWRWLRGGGDGGLLVHVVASLAWVWPFASGGDLFVVAVSSWW